MSYYIERFEAAVLLLVADGPVKQRLAQAYADHLEQLRRADLPQKLGESLAPLHNAMHRVAPMGRKDSPVKASVQKMSPNEACEHAALIVEIYAELLRSGQRAERLKVVDAPSSPAAATNS